MGDINIVADVRDRAVVLRAGGEIDSSTVELLASALDGAAGDAAIHPDRLLVVDLDSVTYFGSAGLNALLGCVDRCAAGGVTVRVVASNAEVIRPLQITRLDAVLRPYPTMAEALASLGTW